LLRDIGAQTNEVVEAISTTLGAATANDAREAYSHTAVADSRCNHYERGCKGQ
jgi:hypothetical protein